MRTPTNKLYAIADTLEYLAINLDPDSLSDHQHCEKLGAILMDMSQRITAISNKL